MSKEISLVSITAGLANGDQSGNQYKFVLITSSGVAVNSVAGGPCLGVLQNAPTDGQAASVGIGGVSKVMAGAAVAVGADVQSDASGKAITAAAADYSQGTALEAAAADGDLIAVALRPNAQLNA